MWEHTSHAYRGISTAPADAAMQGVKWTREAQKRRLNIFHRVTVVWFVIVLLFDRIQHRSFGPVWAHSANQIILSRMQHSEDLFSAGGPQSHMQQGVGKIWCYATPFVTCVLLTSMAETSTNAGVLAVINEQLVVCVSLMPVLTRCYSDLLPQACNTSVADNDTLSAIIYYELLSRSYCAMGELVQNLNNRWKLTHLKLV